MKYPRLLLLAVFLLANCVVQVAHAQSPQATKTLRNDDVLRLHEAGLEPGKIIFKIFTSPCNFDTFPPVLRELKMKGVPDTVILAMRSVPYGPPQSPQVALAVPEPAAKTVRVRIPSGTRLELEIAAPVSSAAAGEGDRLMFLVTRRVMVNGVMVINRGATARARVIKSQPARAWGRSGSITWVLEDVVAIDGSVVPIRLGDRLHGKDRSKAVVAAAIATGAVIFPYSAPVGLIWALKKGDEAVLERSQKSVASVSSDTEVGGLFPQERKVVYHAIDQLKTADPAKSKSLPPMSYSVRPTPIRKH